MLISVQVDVFYRVSWYSLLLTRTISYWNREHKANQNVFKRPRSSITKHIITCLMWN